VRHFENDKLFYIFTGPKRMRRYKVSKVLKKLKKDGWVVVRSRGDHRQLKNTNGKEGLVTVPGKDSDVLSQELLNSIWKQAGWK
jgi:predicted RNA binding protein YcfA (HicA-like mRNA interferase family)